MGAPNKLHLAITFNPDGIYVETRGGADNMTQKKAIPRKGEKDMGQELLETIMAYDPPPEAPKEP